MVTVSKAEVLKIIFDNVGKPATEIYQKLLEHSGETSFPNRSSRFDLG